MNTRTLATALTLLVAATSVWSEGTYPIAWTRQLGTASADRSDSVAVDGAGNVFISGRTEGSLSGTSAGGCDAFLAKYDPAGGSQWIQQLGTASDEHSDSVAVDGAGNAYICGSTPGSLGGPTAGGYDAFLAKYDTAGSLLWTEQLGTGDKDASYSVAVDGAGNAFITGYTNGSLGGPTAGGYDAFLAKYDTGGSLLWTEQLGTADSDVSYSIAVDGAGNAFISGRSGSHDSGGLADVLLAKYDSAGSLQWTEQLGIARDDYGYSIALDAVGNLYVGGTTWDWAGGTGWDAFVAKLDPTGNSLWTQQLGTVYTDYGSSVALDAAGNVYVSGTTAGGLGGPQVGTYDAFLVKLDSAGNLLWTDQLGSGSSDNSTSIATDEAGSVFISGVTYGALGGPSAGGPDAFLIKYEVPVPASAGLLLLGGVAILRRRRAHCC